MKPIQMFFRWGMLYLIAALSIGLCFWENSLAIRPVDQSILMIVTLVISAILINWWISAHVDNFLVPPDEKVEIPEAASNKENR